MTEVTLPVLKAWNRVFDLLDAIDENPYNRNAFEDAVLKLYPGKSPKSVFRGMAIPTLRNLGLILGYGHEIRISANGALIRSAHETSDEEGLRALRCVQFEMDQSHFGVLASIHDGTMADVRGFFEAWIPRVRITDTRVRNDPAARDRAARERITDWIDFLAFSELLHRDREHVAVDSERFRLAKIDADPASGRKEHLFGKVFFDAYMTLSDRRNKTKTIHIELLRQEMAVGVYSEAQELLTESQFDTLLTRLPKTSDEYTISFGRSMGAGEKLFKFQMKYYQSISIRFEDQSELA